MLLKQVSHPDCARFVTQKVCFRLQCDLLRAQGQRRTIQAQHTLSEETSAM